MANIDFEYGDEKIKRSHIESALGYIGEYGEKENGLLYIPYDGEGGLGKGKPKTRELRDKGKRFWIKDVVRIAYLYADEVYPSPKFNPEDIGRVKVNLQWEPDFMKRLLKSKGYTDFGDESEHKEKTKIDWGKITFNDVKDSIKHEHAESALRHFENLERHGLSEKTENGILYVYKKGVPETRALCHKGFLCGLMEVVRIAYLYSIEYDINQENLRKIRRVISGSKDEKWTSDEAETLLKQWYTDFRRIPKGVISNQKSSVENLPEIFRQFHQIILHGPPGTGKTYRAKMEFLPKLLGINIDDKNEQEIKELLKEKQGILWDIVQFHPSYNYEDFVRGVKVTTEDNNVVYKTENRIFGDMCQRAQDDFNNKYVLIIDEINRANVSAVLGELIYALEYRGEYIKTPYIVDGDADATLVIPENLYIIGTMNTADRTIGQIDYAVRRRFAFEHCPPVEKNITDRTANDFFRLVEDLFKNHISRDYNVDDVRIGHSYFMASGKKLAGKIIYQVVPILREYVKDGVLLGESDNVSEIWLRLTNVDDEILLKKAEEKINKIKEKAENLSNSEIENESDEQGASHKKVPFYCWKNEEDFGVSILVRIALSIAKNHVKNNPNITIEILREWFPDVTRNNEQRGIKLEEEIKSEHKKRFHRKEGDGLIVEGKTYYITKAWGNMKDKRPNYFRSFKKEAKNIGYTILDCYPIRTNEEVKKGITNIIFQDPDEFGKVETDDIVFAFLSEDSSGQKGKYVGMGRVLGRSIDLLGKVILRIDWEKTFVVDGKWGATRTALQKLLDNIEKKLKGE